MLFFLLIAVVLSAQERTLLRTREVKERALLDQEDATIWGRLIEESSMSHDDNTGDKKGRRQGGKKEDKKGGDKEEDKVATKMESEERETEREVRKNMMMKGNERR